MSDTKGMQSMIGRKMTKKVKFMDGEVTISKLSVSEVMRIQEQAKEIEKDEKEGLNVLKTVIRSSVDDAESISDEQFNQFPMDELSKLSNEIMKFSGIGGEAAGK